MKKKTEALLDLLIGILFLAVGVLLISMESGMTLVVGVAAADLLLGAVLSISGMIGMAKRTADADETAEEPAEDWNNAAYEQPAEMNFVPVAAAAEETWNESEQTAEEPSEDVSVEALTAREAELRKLVKQRRMEARQNADAAEQANAAAAAAEQALVEAENEMKYVSDDEKRAYLAKIDHLADDAMEKSQQAVFAARKAKASERALSEAIAEHRKAMDAAAEAMMAAEDAEWNNR